MLIGAGATLLGGAIAGVTRRAEYELPRTQYFVYTSLIFLAVSSTQIVWIQSIPAINAGLLWTLMVFSVFAATAGGFCVAEIAMARSRHAIGHGRMAYLAFIPIAALWLLFEKPRQPHSIHRAPSIAVVSGSLGIVMGVLLYIFGFAVMGFTQIEVEQMSERAQNDPPAQLAGVTMLLGMNGLEETLQLMAAEALTPLVIDEVTTLESVEAEGRQLHRTYIITSKITSLAQDFPSRIVDSICSFAPFQPLLLAGASIHENYVRLDGLVLEVVAVDRTSCGL